MFYSILERCITLRYNHQFNKTLVIFSNSYTTVLDSATACIRYTFTHYEIILDFMSVVYNINYTE